MLPTTPQAASRESTQVIRLFVEFIVFTAQCGLLLKLLYIRITITLVRSSRIRLFMCNNVFLHNFMKLDKIQSSTAMHIKKTQSHGIFIAWKENTKHPTLVSLLTAGGKVTTCFLRDNRLHCQRINNLLYKHWCLKSKFKKYVCG